MTITPSPIRQSWATWLSPMTRHSRPIFVQPSARVERCTLTYSRITVTAPTRTPASSRARGSTIAEGWMASVIALRLALELTAERLDRALQRAHALEQLGQPRLRGEDAPRLHDGPRRRAEVAAARVEVRRHAALGRDQRAVADGHVIGHAHLTRQHDAAPQLRAARHADLGHEDRVLTHLDVVPDLDEIVDLGAAADDRVAEGRAVDRAVGADLHVVLHDHPARLGDLAVARAVEGEAEAVGADDGAGVHEHAAPQAHAGQQRHVWTQHAALADLRAGADEHEGADSRARPDARARLDHRQRSHGRRG